jgi:hypothetical protein
LPAALPARAQRADRRLPRARAEASRPGSVAPDARSARFGRTKPGCLLDAKALARPKRRRLDSRVQREQLVEASCETGGDRVERVAAPDHVVLGHDARRRRAACRLRPRGHVTGRRRRGRRVRAQRRPNEQHDPRDSEEEDGRRNPARPASASAAEQSPAARPRRWPPPVYQPETVHTSRWSRAASAPAAARQSPFCSRNAYITDREAVTSALAGPLVNARAMSAGVAP